MRRWVVREGEAGTIADVLAALHTDSSAVAAGRVFLGRKRVHNTQERIVPGDTVTVGRAPTNVPGEVRVLARANGVVAVDKPAGIPTIADHADRAHSLHGVVARQLGVEPDALHASSRLDRGVSGVVVFTTSGQAAATLRSAREHGTYARRYVALASCAPDPPAGTWDAPIGRGTNPRLRTIGGRNPAPATTSYRTVAVAGGVAMLRIEPATGRTHQIRVHAAGAGCALLGDRDYGGPVRRVLPTGKVLALARIALHCARVATPIVEGSAEIPPEMRALWTALGGDDAAWTRAVAPSDLAST